MCMCACVRVYVTNSCATHAHTQPEGSGIFLAKAHVHACAWAQRVRPLDPAAERETHSHINTKTHPNQIDIVFTTDCCCFRFAMNARAAMNDPMEHATGLEKRELLAKAAGNEDPFDMHVMKRAVGAKDSPTLIPSAFDARIVGCVCK